MTGASRRGRRASSGDGPDLLGESDRQGLPNASQGVQVVHGQDEDTPTAEVHRGKRRLVRGPPIVHFLLGTRYDESMARTRTMENHSRMGTDIHAHGTMPTSGVIRPIEDWDAGMVWDYLLTPEWANGGQIHSST